MSTNDKEIRFGEALARVKRQARENGGLISSADVRAAFSEFDLDDGRMEEVFRYLKENRISIDEKDDDKEYLGEEEKDFLADYMASLEGEEKLSEQEKTRLAELAVNGDPDAQKRYAQDMLVTVPDIARLYLQQGVMIEDLIGEGNVALFHAASLLGALDDASEVDAALSHAVMDAMESLIAENLQEDARGQRAVGRVNEVADRAKELADDLRRPVTPEELMNETGWDMDKIVEAWKLSGGMIEDLDMSQIKNDK